MGALGRLQLGPWGLYRGIFPGALVRPTLGVAPSSPPSNMLNKTILSRYSRVGMGESGQNRGRWECKILFFGLYTHRTAWLVVTVTEILEVPKF